MESIEARQLINKIQRDVLNSGMVIESLVENLKNLREFALEAQDPTVTKVLRLTYEHLETNNGFFIPIPPEDPEEVEEGEEQPEPEPPQPIETMEQSIESFEYLLSLIMRSTNKNNRTDLQKYRDLFLSF